MARAVRSVVFEPHYDVGQPKRGPPVSERRLLARNAEQRAQTRKKRPLVRPTSEWTDTYAPGGIQELIEESSSPRRRAARRRGPESSSLRNGVDSLASSSESEISESGAFDSGFPRSVISTP